jgi:hypothetical protein
MDPTNAGAPFELPDVQAATAAATAPPSLPPADDASGTAKNVGDPELVARIERAASGAIDQHLDEQAAKPRKRGQRGPDRNPGSRPPRARAVPLASLDGLPDPALLAEDIPTPLVPGAADLPPEPAPFDRDAAQEIVGFATEFINDIAGVGMESWALKHLGDAQLAADAGAKARMTDKLRDRLEKGLVLLAEKHRLALDMAPEVIVGGCFILWGTNLRKQAVAIRVQGEQLRTDPAELAERVAA